MGERAERRRASSRGKRAPGSQQRAPRAGVRGDGVGRRLTDVLVEDLLAHDGAARGRARAWSAAVVGGGPIDSRVGPQPAEISTERRQVKRGGRWPSFGVLDLLRHFCSEVTGAGAVDLARPLSLEPPPSSAQRWAQLQCSSASATRRACGADTSRPTLVRSPSSRPTSHPCL